MTNFLFFGGSLFLLIKSANWAIHHSTHLAKSLRIATHVVGFLIVALISVLPEALISINSALQGVPAFGLGTLFGSNVADLTLVLALVIFLSREMKIQKNILDLNTWFVLAISTPLLFGLNGHYSRLEGFLLVLVGIAFYIYILRKARKEVSNVSYTFSTKNLFYLILCMGMLLVSAHYTVEYGVALAHQLQISPLLIGMFLVGLGTTLPEMFFSVKAVAKNRDGLALGDIFGTVITDATLIVGIMALITPFSFDPLIIQVTGFFMLLAAVFLFTLMRSGKRLTRKEGVLLALFYAFYAATELYLNSGANGS